MLLLFCVIALTDAQQTAHDHAEWAMYQRIEADKAAILDIWHPSSKVLSDLHRAQGCYVKFHLNRVPNCDAELKAIEVDLGQVELAETGHR